MGDFRLNNNNNKKHMTIQLDQTIIGKKFTAFDPNNEYVCVGFAQNNTLLVLGALNDVTNNRFNIMSFKLSEVKFLGQMP